MIVHQVQKEEANKNMMNYLVPSFLTASRYPQDQVQKRKERNPENIQKRRKKVKENKDRKTKQREKKIKQREKKQRKRKELNFYSNCIPSF